jgi:hypothetical protein
LPGMQAQGFERGRLGCGHIELENEDYAVQSSPRPLPSSASAS